jgi:rhodanese-related sulfurtransferase
MSGVITISPTAAWAALRTDPKAILVDVRTEAEWTFVGVPDLSSIGRQIGLVSWQTFPGMQPNPNFVEDLRRVGIIADNKLMLICRSGVRSLAAGQAALAGGFPQVFNVTDGFEGPLNAAGHRASRAGWQYSRLPWRQP